MISCGVVIELTYYLCSGIYLGIQKHKKTYKTFRSMIFKYDNLTNNMCECEIHIMFLAPFLTQTHKYKNGYIILFKYGCFCTCSHIFHNQNNLWTFSLPFKYISTYRVHNFAGIILCTLTLHIL